MKTLWRAGIIAAGEGSRLRAAYPATPKPLVPVQGLPLVHRIVESLRLAGIRRITILLNSKGEPVRRYLESAFQEMEWVFLCQDTPTSWESFRIVSQNLSREASSPFVMTTVDALIPPLETARFLDESTAAFQTGRARAALALTRFVEDEKPLWADRDPSGLVSALGPDARGREFVTCGLYALTPKVVGAPMRHPRLRDFWISEVRKGLGVLGVVLAQTVDLDRPEDLASAEALVGETTGPALAQPLPALAGSPRGRPQCAA